MRSFDAATSERVDDYHEEEESERKNSCLFTNRAGKA